MAATPTVLILSRDAEVKLVTATLQGEGITSRAVGGLRDLRRTVESGTGRYVAVLDADVAADPKFSMPQALEVLRGFPLLVLLSAEADASTLHDTERVTVEEYARKRITPSVLALRIKALI